MSISSIDTFEFAFERAKHFLTLYNILHKKRLGKEHFTHDYISELLRSSIGEFVRALDKVVVSTTLQGKKPRKKTSKVS